MLNVGDHFDAEDHHTDVTGQLSSVLAADLAQMLTSQLFEEARRRNPNAVAEEIQALIQRKAADGDPQGQELGKAYREQTGLDGIELDYSGLVFRCGRCRCYWKAASRGDTQCVRCGFVAPLKTYEDREDEGRAEGGLDPRIVEKYGEEIVRLVQSDDKTLKKRLKIVPSLKNVVGTMHLVKSGDLDAVEGKQQLRAAIQAFLTEARTVKKVAQSIDNLERAFPYVHHFHGRELSNLLESVKAGG